MLHHHNLEEPCDGSCPAYVSAPGRSTLEPISANSVVYTATSIEAIALRLRQSVTAGKGDCHVVLEWAKAELERCAGELESMIPDVRAKECAVQAAE